MYDEVTQTVCQTFDDEKAQLVEKVQRLWSDYGAILRYRLPSQARTIIVKVIDPPRDVVHPRGWVSDFSAQRKMRSYEVERYFYQHVASMDSHCRTAQCFGVVASPSGQLLLLEDLDASGYALRQTQPDTGQIQAMLSWLAYFHGQHLNAGFDGLWQRGSYWHLATRPEELEAMPECDLKRRAWVIDKKLNSVAIQTLIHGDAKVANFCFAVDDQVAAVDFQYVGRGVGTVDVMYLLGSCLEDDELHESAQSLIDDYFEYLRKACEHYKVSIPFEQIETQWREILPFAWADFQRFLEGWSPGHWKVNTYTQGQTDIALAMLEEG
jgi:hypothetical protein